MDKSKEVVLSLNYSLSLCFYQVMSPVTGRVIGTSEVRVVKSKEAITGLRVRVITGIGLAVTQEVGSSSSSHNNNNAAVGAASASSVNIFNVETTLADKLNAKYQVSRISPNFSFIFLLTRQQDEY
jgi:Transmembrane protein family 132